MDKKQTAKKDLYLVSELIFAYAITLLQPILENKYICKSHGPVVTVTDSQSRGCRFKSQIDVCL